MSYSIESITESIGARRVGNVPATIDWLLTDSRSLNFPEETLFFALTTKRNDGARYIADLYARGVRNFVLSEESFRLIEHGELKIDNDAQQPAIHFQSSTVNYLIVSNPLKALQKLAEQHRNRFQIPVIGITGSNGKTVVKEWLHQLLSPERAIIRSPRSYNSQIGVPLSVWQMNEQSELAIFEAGISEPGEMRALQNIIKPTIGILTNIGGAHQENFFSLQEKCMEKLMLFKNCDVVIYNGDDEFVSNCVAKSMLSAREIAWSRKDMERPLYISKVEKQDDCTVISYRYLDMDNTFTLPFIDDASIENSLNCLAACLYLMLPAERITERMAKLEPIAMRLEVKEGKNNCLLINDSYNSDLGSLDIALDFLYRRSQSKGLRRTLILSDILETGQNTPTLYRQVAQLVNSRGIERIIGVGNEISSCAARFNIEKTFYPDTAALIRTIQRGELRLENEIILIKGARKFGFDSLTEVLEKKVHETILEVNLGAMIANLNYYRGKLKPETKMVCMVKAFGYGSGSYELAKTLQEHRCDYLAVAVADEGAALRKEGITIPIIVMNPEFSSFNTMFEYNLEPEVYSFRLLDAMIKETERRGIIAYPIHIKIDTGMHRLGFQPYEVSQLIERLKTQSGVKVRSVFSHLAGSDSYVFDDFTQQQLEKFKEASTTLEKGLEHPVIKHILNTAGIERFPQWQMDMVRLGIGLYGVSASGVNGLRTVSKLKTTILQIQHVPAGDSIGYSRRSYVERDSRIAIIPIGYADGLDRHFSNGHGEVIIRGKRCPIIGNICMDACMVDVTDSDAQEGDSVIVFGEELPVSELSDRLKTIPYEILTSVSPRVKRVYYWE